MTTRKKVKNPKTVITDDKVGEVEEEQIEFEE